MSDQVQPGCEAWEAEGSGERARVGIAVVHGFTGNPHSTTPLGRRLNAEGYTVVVPRLPGHGTSPKDMARTRFDDWLGEVERVTDDLVARCDHVVLVGLSMGGTLVLDVASRRPVAGVVAVNAQMRDPEQLLAKLAPLLMHVVPMVPRDLAGLPSGDIARPGADEKAYPTIPAKAAHSLTSRFPQVREHLRGATVPALVAWSPQDHTVPPTNSQTIIELLAGDVETLVMERSYHVATLDWDAEALEDAVLAFVERVSTA